MLLFSTVLPINDTLTKDGFIELAIRWNQGSRHEENVIPDIEWNGERNIKFGNEKLWMQIEEYRNQNIIAIRYEKIQDDGVVWDTDFVMNFNEMKMSVRLDRSYLEEALTEYKTFSTPAFIALLIDGGFVTDDNGLAIGRKPVAINEKNYSLIADVINGDAHYSLPVVYVSKMHDERIPVNVREVAKRLKGVAHVFYQEHSWSDPALHRLCNKKNEYDGAIGIYFPSQAVGHEKILNHIFPGSEKKMTDKVVSRVIQYSNVQRIDALYTWPGVSNALLRDRYSSKREELAKSQAAMKLYEMAAQISQYEAQLKVEDADQKAEKMKKEAEEALELVASVDEEMEQMRQQIETLTKQNDSLQSINEGLLAKVQETSKMPLLYFGSEDEFFPGEIKEIVLEVLDRELHDRTEAQTRRSDVLGDVVRSNGGITGQTEQKKNKVKELMNAYTAMTGTVRSALKELGFTIKEEGKHYKLVYYNDGRYWITLAKSPSDKAHGGKNAAMKIIKKVL